MTTDTPAQLACSSAMFVLGALNADEERELLKLLASSPAARSALDEGEALLAAMTAPAGSVTPPARVLDQALQEIDRSLSPAKPKPFALGEQIPSMALRKAETKSFLRRNWPAAAAAALFLGGVGLFWQQQRRLDRLSHQLTAARAEAQSIAARNPTLANDELVGSVSNGTSGDTSEDSLAADEGGNDLLRQGTAPQTSIGDPKSGLPSWRQVANASHQPSQDQPKEPARSALLAPGSKQRLDSLFIELTAPNAPTSDSTAESRQQLASIVSDHMAAAATSVDTAKGGQNSEKSNTEDDQPTPTDDSETTDDQTTEKAPPIIGDSSGLSDFELYPGFWEMGNGVLYSEASGQFLVPRGDGRSYEIRLPGSGFDPAKIVEARQALAEAQKAVTKETEPTTATTRSAQNAAVEAAQPDASATAMPTSPTTSPKDSTPTAQSPPRAYLHVDRETGDGFIIVRRLPQASPGSVYRLWQQEGASLTLVGDLPPTSEGQQDRSELHVSQPERLSGFIITQEPQNASTQSPQGTVILQGR